MPWTVRRDSQCPDDEPWAVVNSNGTLVGCHETREQAQAQRTALCATKDRLSRMDWTPVGG